MLGLIPNFYLINSAGIAYHIMGQISVRLLSSCKIFETILDMYDHMISVGISRGEEITLIEERVGFWLAIDTKDQYKSLNIQTLSPIEDYISGTPITSLKPIKKNTTADLLCYSRLSHIY
ncbi:hypothetical protein EIJ81_01075 (plasmid) [Aliivibrio salmonicida]|uniref:hypothetical protein n=1 Tax=Aliivibrio salmonicida TaxID=40269 RepID=UPI000F6CFAAB|nr:hypothetical protein [Aliivibrio salmonicida]AZL83492.1 hypothetical protein EIJ81_01075 [Aliivibrio salmonicida]